MLALWRDSVGQLNGTELLLLLLISPVLAPLTSKTISFESGSLLIQMKTIMVKINKTPHLWLTQNSELNYTPPPQKKNNKSTKFLRESLACMLDKCSPAALQSRPAACWRLQQRHFMALLLLGCKFSGWLLSLRIDPHRHLEPRYWHMGRRWAGSSGNLPTLNYDIHRWCHNRGTGLWDTHPHPHRPSLGYWIHLFELCAQKHTLKIHSDQRLSFLNGI